MFSYLSKNSLAVFTILSIASLIIAAFINSLPFWIIPSAWFIFFSCVIIRVIRIPNDSPYKQSFYLLVLPLIFGVTIWLKSFLPLLLEPSTKHLFGFLFSKAFLFLTAFYFAGVSIFYGRNIDEQEKQKSLSTFLRTNFKEPIMVKKLHYNVILTPEARQLISEEPISRLLKGKRYFNCIEINPSSPYFFMKIEENDDTLGKIITEVSIPHSCVLYYVSAESNKHLGF
jgi:hypothetical protein